MSNPLDFNRLAKPAARETSVAPSRPVVTVAAVDAQISIKGPAHVIDRFKRLCKDDRRHYYDMLEILMDKFET